MQKVYHIRTRIRENVDKFFSTDFLRRRDAESRGRRELRDRADHRRPIGHRPGERVESLEQFESSGAQDVSPLKLEAFRSDIRIDRHSELRANGTADIQMHLGLTI
jgi:hypothetical protein